MLYLTRIILDLIGEYKLLEAKIINLAITDKGFAIILKPDEGEKVVPIFVATVEAQSIMVGFLGFEQSRPLSHDLLKSIILKCDINLKYMIIDDVKDTMFFAKVVIEKNEELIYIDSRPSDAIALALRIKCPVFIDESVLDASGIVIEEINSISLKEELPFEYKSLNENDIIKDPNIIFKKYSDLNNLSPVKDEKKIYENINNDETIKNTNNKNNKDKEKLEKLLEEAIRDERYEDAAGYRDDLNNL